MGDKRKQQGSPSNRLIGLWCLLLSSLLLTIACQQTALAKQTFVSVAFHDVVDTESELDQDAITTDRLIGFFEYLLADQWTVLSLDDVKAAQAGEKVLPQKSILITFDDGYASLYSRVFPLLKAYRFPIVSALVGQWMDAPMHAKVNYGGKLVARSNFLSWEQVREMRASGLVEFASHSYDQHLSMQADIHGTQTPAMVTYAFEAQANEYENPARFEARIRQDMLANNRLFIRELGAAPRAFVWPFGRYSLKTIQIARELGYEFAINLNDEPSTADMPMEIARYLPERNPTLGAMLTDLRYQPGFTPTVRVVGLDIAQVWSPDADEFNRQLGQLIEDVRRLRPTAVVFKPYSISADGLLSSWFADHGDVTQRTTAAARIIWQIQRRAGVNVYAQVSLRELEHALGTKERVLAWFDALGRQVPLGGVLFEQADWIHTLQAPASTLSGPWSVRQLRRTLDLQSLVPTARFALQAFRQIEQYRPTLDLAVWVSSQPGTLTGMTVPSVLDLVLIDSTDRHGDINQSLLNWVSGAVAENPLAHRRIGLWLGNVTTRAQAEKIAQQSKDLIAGGVTALGWHVELDREFGAIVDILAPAVSAATFPVRF